MISDHSITILNLALSKGVDQSQILKWFIYCHEKCNKPNAFVIKDETENDNDRESLMA